MNHFELQVDVSQCFYTEQKPSTTSRTYFQHKYIRIIWNISQFGITEFAKLRKTVFIIRNELMHETKPTNGLQNFQTLLHFTNIPIHALCACSKQFSPMQG